MIKRDDFNKTVNDLRQYPQSFYIQKDYNEHLAHLAEIILHKCKVNYEEFSDMTQDLIELAIRKKLHERTDKRYDVFSFYWLTFMRATWKLKKRSVKKTVGNTQKNEMFEQILTDDGEGEMAILRELDFSLDDYDPENVISFFDRLPSVEVKATEPKSQQPKKPSPFKEYHWDNLFDLLKMEKSLTETALINALPEKKKALKNLQWMLRTRLGSIAKNSGFKLSVTDNGVDKVYLLLGGN